MLGGEKGKEGEGEEMRASEGDSAGVYVGSGLIRKGVVGYGE